MQVFAQHYMGFSVVAQQEIDRLGAIERAAAAHRHDQVDLEGRAEGAARLNHDRSRIRLKLVEAVYRHAARFQRARCFAGVTRLHDSGVGYQQAARASQVSSHFAQPRELACAEDYPGPGSKVEGSHLVFRILHYWRLLLLHRRTRRPRAWKPAPGRREQAR